MRQSVRALGLTVTISLLLLSVFLATAIYSVVQTSIVERGIELGEAQIHVFDNEFMLSIPLKVNNTGYYDLTEVRLTTILSSREGIVLAANTSVIDLVERGINVTAIHRLWINTVDLFTNMTYLLVNDTYFYMNSSIGFRYVHVLDSRSL